MSPPPPHDPIDQGLNWTESNGRTFHCRQSRLSPAANPFLVCFERRTSLAGFIELYYFSVVWFCRCRPLSSRCLTSPTPGRTVTPALLGRYAYSSSLSLSSTSFSPLCSLSFTLVFALIHPCFRYRSFALVFAIIHPCVHSHSPLCSLSFTLVFTLIHPCVRNHSPLCSLSFTLVFALIHPCVRYHSPLCSLSFTLVFAIIHPCVHSHSPLCS